MKITEHFDSNEFLCECGCGRMNMKNSTIEHFEQFFGTLDGVDKIIVTSGCRCPSCSVSVGGYADDAHTVGIAADIVAYDRFGNLISPWKIAEAAEKLGFNGIGVMSTACHCDERTTENYKNGHWFGDETTGKNVDTFITKTERLSDGSIEALQNVLNDKGYRLTVNGVASKKTLSACRNYTIGNGDSGPLTKWVQSRLNSIGFDCGTADGIAGNKTMSAIAEFQKEKGLGQGYLGGRDWDMLIK